MSSTCLRLPLRSYSFLRISSSSVWICTWISYFLNSAARASLVFRLATFSRPVWMLFSRP